MAAYTATMSDNSVLSGSTSTARINPRLLILMGESIRAKHYSLRTE
jgi:hypothetical protein